jgi:phosphonate transport system substrate-binding protein
LHRAAAAALALLLWGAAGAQGSAPAPQSLAFGVFPRWSAQATVRDFTPLARVLGQTLGREVRVETDKDFESFMRRVHAGAFELAHLNQLQYLQASAGGRYRAVARICEAGACSIQGIVLVRRDSEIHELADLRGRTVAFADPGAFVSYVLTRSVLGEAGLGPADYRALFTRSPPNAVLALYNGAADAAGVGPSVLRRPDLLRHVDVGALRVLAESPPLPHLPVAVRADLDPELAEGITAALVGLHTRPGGAEALGRLGIERFAPADDADYRVLPVEDEGAGARP